MSIRIVKRSDFVKPLLPGTTVAAEDAFIDRINLTIGDWALFGEQDDICSALEFMRRETTIETQHGELLQVFQGPLIERIWDVRNLRFTANPRTDSLDQAHTLVSGTVELGNWGTRPHSRQDGEQARISFRTQLNLTRFLQAQQLKRIPHPEKPALATGYILAITPEQRWYRDELPLLPATNIIIGQNAKYAYALKSTREAQFRRYLKLIYAFLKRAIETSFEGENAEVRRLAYYSLHEIEFYWDFDHDNPIDYVISILPHLRQSSANVREVEYEVNVPRLDLSCQSPCIKLALTRNIELKVYAKTNRRVRFEISFKDSAIGAHGGGQTAASIAIMAHKIPLLAEEAAKRCNDVMQTIAAARPPPSTVSALQLMHEIYARARNPYVAEAIVAALVTFERIVPYNNDPLKDTIHDLRDAGVLQTRRPRSRVYVVTDDYQQPLQRLRQMR